MGGVNWEGEWGDPPRTKGRGGRTWGAGNREEGGEVLDHLYPLSERERGRHSRGHKSESQGGKQESGQKRGRNGGGENERLEH